MTIWRSKDGDMVDEIARSHYGTEAMTAAIYTANPGLAALGPVLPKGLLIHLSDTPPRATRKPIRLWSARDAD